MEATTHLLQSGVPYHNIICTLPGFLLGSTKIFFWSPVVPIQNSTNLGVYQDTVIGEDIIFTHQVNHNKHDLWVNACNYKM